MRRAQAGDHQAFEALYRQHVDRVYALCLRLSGDPARAVELTQDVFIRTWRKIGSFRGASAFGSWLHRLAVNVVMSAHRSTGRRRDREVEDESVVQAAAATSDPGQRLDLEAAVARLPKGAREVFVLHDVEGYGHAEVGEMLGIAAGTSKAQLHRARRLLREMLA